MPKEGRGKQSGATGTQKKLDKSISSNNTSILNVLAFPIIVATLLVSLSILEGLVTFPPTPVVNPHIHTHENPHDMVPKILLSPGNPSHKVFLWNPSRKVPISPWHDVPLYGPKNEIRYIVEIPRGTGAKLEIQSGSFLNPILQDKFKKNGNYRFTQEAYPFNYGAFSQTWEDPSIPDHWTGLGGDNDPLDVVELGNGIYYPGDIVTVKIIGVLGLLGTGDETDWKIIVLDVNNPLAEKWDDVDDIDRELKLSIVEFFSFYKVPEGEVPSKFAFNSQILNKTFAQTIIDDKHLKWKNLVRGPVDPVVNSRVFSTKCVLCPEPMNQNNKVSDKEAREWAEKAVKDVLEGL